MALITLTEILHFAILTLVVGYILSGMFVSRAKTIYDRMHPKRFKWADLKFAIIVAAPAIILHELAHKFVAMAYGFEATFQLFPFGLALGLFLKLIGSPFLIIAPGYVTIDPAAFANPFAYRLIAFAGPAVNLILWLGSLFILKTRKLNRTPFAVLSMTKFLNMLLFFFNMIPFGPFDGQKVFFGPPS
ncbi:M50 family metallopeptidase [archaeon]|nr:M50 family metallopeptidase [archaeon]